jgi:AcrR family transcriptional regulator
LRQPPGRRRVPRAERERQMLDVADDVFAERGYHAASMDEIARRVGVAKPMLYNYFGSKQGLYLANVQRHGQTLVERLRAVAPEGAPADQLAAGVAAFFGFVDEHRSGWSVLYNEAATAGGPFARRVAELREQIARTVAALLRALAQEGELDRSPVADPDALAYAVVGAGESLANWWLHQRPRDNPELMVQRLMTVVWLGLGQLERGRAWPAVAAGRG